MWWSTENLPLHLFCTPLDLEFRDGSDHVEIWDADDFDPWESLQWDTVRVIRYRQHHRDGEIVEAYWLSNFSSRRMSRRCLYAMAKSRWQIENQGFNDTKNRYGLEHIRHHHERSLLLVWLLTCLASHGSGSTVCGTCIVARMWCAPPSIFSAFSNSACRCRWSPIPVEKRIGAVT